MSDKNLDCTSGLVWMGITDSQGEGRFLNVSRYTYEDVFVYEKDVGHKLTDERWMEHEPRSNAVAFSKEFPLT